MLIIDEVKFMLYNDLTTRKHAENKRNLYMRHSDRTIHFVRNLVNLHAFYDKLSESYILPVNNLPEFTQCEFASLLMNEDDAYASESTGADNPSYETKMLPRLIHFLRFSEDRDEEIEFIKEWREGVTSYFKNTMQELLNEYCVEKIHDRRENQWERAIA
jgi:hypothetical protein